MGKHTKKLASAASRPRHRFPVLRQPHAFKRRASGPAANVWNDHQFQRVNIRQVNCVVLNFTCRLWGTEVPLLPHNFTKTFVILRRPAQNELLSTVTFSFVENQVNAPDLLRLAEDKADCLDSRAGGTPSLPASDRKGSFDRIGIV